MAEDLLEEIEESGTPGGVNDSQGGDGIDGEAGKTKPGRFGFVRKLFAGKRKFLVLIVLVVLITAGAGVWFFFFSGPDEAARQAELEAAATAAAEEQKKEVVFEDIVDLEPFEHLPLKTGSAMGHLSLGVSLELSDHRFRKQVHTSRERIRKIIASQVKTATWIELRNPEGKLKLKYDLLSRINSLFPRVMVRDLYFTNFLMQ